MIQTRRIPVVLYVPNLLCYLRILTALLGFYLCQNDRPVAALWTWLSSSFLDLFDGILARYLNQTSSLGVFLDIAADNILRTCIWIAVSLQVPQLAILSCIIISNEWFTMVTTQLHSSIHSMHWKDARSNDPWFIRQVFQNGFKNPWGIWTIYGLFGAPLFLWASHHPILTRNIPFLPFWIYTCYAGRALAFVVELRLSYSYLSHVLDQDTKKRDEERDR